MQTMPKKQYTTRLDPDDAEAVEKYRKERELTQAEAIRRLVRDRLDTLSDDLDETEAMPDGGEVVRRLDRQKQNQRWRTTAILAGLLYALLYFEGFRGLPSIVMGILVFVALVVATYGVADAAAALGGGRDE